MKAVSYKKLESGKYRVEYLVDEKEPVELMDCGTKDEAIANALQQAILLFREFFMVQSPEDGMIVSKYED